MLATGCDTKVQPPWAASRSTWTMGILGFLTCRSPRPACWKIIQGMERKAPTLEVTGSAQKVAPPTHRLPPFNTPELIWKFFFSFGTWGWGRIFAQFLHVSPFLLKLIVLSLVYILVHSLTILRQGLRTQKCFQDPDFYFSPKNPITIH